MQSGTAASIGSTSNDSIVIGSSANTSQKCAIVIGSNDNNGGGLAPSATGINAIVIGSANAGVGGASGAGLASIAIGGADGTVNGALNFGARSIAIGTAADVSTVLCNDSIVIGSSANTAQKCTIVIGSSDNNGGGLAPSASGVNAIVIGSANAGVNGASGVGLASIAIGGSDGTVSGATVSVPGVRSVAIGTGANISQSDAILLGNAGNTAVAVGIGTNSPQGKLHIVGGNISSSPTPTVPIVIDCVTPTYSGHCPRILNIPQTAAGSDAALPLQIATTGSIPGAVFAATSSARFKENIRSIGSKSSDIYKLQPRVFQSKDAEIKHDIFGFIAEEVAQDFPELVIYEADGTTPLALYFDGFHALAINEIQKHQQRLEAQDKRLHEQSMIINELLNRIERLES